MLSTASGQGLISTGADALQPFILHRPTTLAEAVEVQGSSGWEATWAHGTTDLVAQFREGLRPKRVISLRRVEELSSVGQGDGEVLIGAGVTHGDASTDPTLAQLAPDLQRHWAAVANVRVRFRATIGGNVLAKRNRYELPLLLGCVDGIASFTGPEGPFELAARDVAHTNTTNALLHHLRVPTDARLGYDRSLRPLMTVAVGRRGDGPVIVAVGGMGAPPWFLTTHGESPDDVTTEVADTFPSHEIFDRDVNACTMILSHLSRRAGAQIL